MQIKKYEDKAISAFPIKWISFYQDVSLSLKYIILDTYHATGILTLRVTQFEKITTQSKKDILFNYSNNN